MKTLWIITTKTNLHVGNENTSTYGIVDLAVQRNVTTQLPCINSSSLKGALSEFAVRHLEENGRSRLLIKIFGSDKSGESSSSKKGKFTFFDAELLFMPAQGPAYENDNSLFHLEISKNILGGFRDKMKIFGIPVDTDDRKLIVGLKKALDIDKKIKLIDSDEVFSADELPIIARNVLENGESKNLWYEQVVPAETVFYTIIDDDNDRDAAETFFTCIKKNLVQIGAGATIGYGYCSFQQISTNVLKNE